MAIAMSVIELDADRLRLQRLIAYHEEQEQRPPGLHLSTIKDDYVKTLKMGMVGDREQADETGNRELLWALGQAWESLVIEGLKVDGIRGAKPQPRQSAEGVWCSPDFSEARTGTIHEMKATWLKDPGVEGLAAWKMQKYVMQLEAYMYIWGVLLGVLHVCHVNGSWQPPQPTCRVYRVRRTVGELEDRWGSLMQHARDRKLLRVA